MPFSRLANRIGKGWRRTALVNTIAVFAFSLFTTILLGWSSTKRGGINTNLIIFEGTCSKSESINLWLHLLLNAFSTGILASSNFFMQVLSSPTRPELDKAHHEGVSLRIGIHSFTNLFHLSGIKPFFWILFLISSLPIHLFFNSALFVTGFKGADWHLTIASEGFSRGAGYFAPGAVLWRGGAPYNEYEWVGHVKAGYGTIANVSEYYDSSSNTSRSIQYAAEASSSWKRLEVAECLSQYVYCNPHNKYRDVVWVVKSQNASHMVAGDEALGWQRGNIVQTTSGLQDAHFEWDDHVPALANNSLWFAANCSTKVFFNIDQHQTKGCYQSCGDATGKATTRFEAKSPDSIGSSYKFDFFPRLGDFSEHELQDLYWPGLRDPSTSALDLQYCMAQEVSSSCKILLSNKLLLCVVICTIVKGVLCATVLFVLPKDEPLVVLGDAIASFIHKPDQTTSVRAISDQGIRDLTPGARAGAHNVAAAQQHPGTRRRWAAAIEPAGWFGSYSLFTLNVIFLSAVFGLAQSTNPVGSSHQSLSNSASNGILSTTGGTAESFNSSVLTANLPQLLLSTLYFTYNSIYTRLCAEKEWNEYGSDYRALRVTRPRGQQRSTYRLQLPYQYSIPLIIISIILHWLVSNALYVFVLEGGYYWVDSDALTYNGTTPTAPQGSGLSDDAYVGIGYSTIAILTLLIAAVVLPAVPLILGLKRLKSIMPLIRGSSMKISAACHVPILGSKNLSNNISRKSSSDPRPEKRNETIKQSKTQPHDDSREYELQYLLPSGVVESEQLEALTTRQSSLVESPQPQAESYLLEVSRNPVRWGAIKAPSSREVLDSERDPSKEYLSFGSRAHDVRQPSNID